MLDDEKAPETEEAESEAEDSAAEAPEELAAKVEEYHEKWLRALADLENFKKKTEQDRRELSVFANVMLVKSLLPILDDMERAFDSLDAGTAGLDWVEGLKLVSRKLLSTLEGQGLSVIATVGEPFDPTMHEAVMQAEGEEGVVVGELQKGYRFHDRVVRPAMVQVGAGVSTPAGGAKDA